jgi:hypothetical protein
MQSRTRFSTFPRKEDDMSWFQNKANARMKAAKEAETLITLLKREMVHFESLSSL